MISPRPLPTLEYLNECFRYDQETGALFWKVRPRAHFLNQQAHSSFNTRFPGKRADTLKHWRYRVHLTINGKWAKFGSHRIVWKMVYGVEPGPILDHIDRNALNNRISNLRDVTQFENCLNRTTCDTPGIGVRRAASGRFEAHVKVRSKNHYLGRFDTFELAQTAVAHMRDELRQQILQEIYQ